MYDLLSWTTIMIDRKIFMILCKCTIYIIVQILFDNQWFAIEKSYTFYKLYDLLSWTIIPVDWKFSWFCESVRFILSYMFCLIINDLRWTNRTLFRKCTIQNYVPAMHVSLLCGDASYASLPYGSLTLKWSGRSALSALYEKCAILTFWNDTYRIRV